MAELQFEIEMEVRRSAGETGSNVHDVSGAIEQFGRLMDAVISGSGYSDDERRPELLIHVVHFGSPLQITGAIKYVSDFASKKIPELLNAIMDRILYYDLERERREIANRSAVADYQAKSIENARALIALLREAKTELDLEDLATLSDAIHRLSGFHANVRQHRIGPVTGGAAAVVEEPKKDK